MDTSPKSSFLKDRRVVVLGGMALALVAGLIVAFVVLGKRDASSEAPPASQGGLIVQTGRDDDIKLDPQRPLRCFVGGQFVGELPLVACAHRNGVASGALDVGLDPSGALAASGGASSQITPLPPQAETPPAADPAQQADSVVSVSPPAGGGRPLAVCQRYAGGQWTPLPGESALLACAQSLYGGQCVHAGAAIYGRWGDRTLRLVPGRVEISSDNRNFHLLAEQGPACSLPAAG